MTASALRAYLFGSFALPPEKAEAAPSAKANLLSSAVARPLARRKWSHPFDLSMVLIPQASQESALQELQIQLAHLSPYDFEEHNLAENKEQQPSISLAQLAE